MVEGNGLSKWSEEKLKIKMEQSRKSAEFHRAQASEEEALFVEYRTEIGRRHRETFWKAHPDLLRLDIGDELLVTQEYRDYIRDFDASLMPNYFLRRVFHIMDMKVNGAANDYVLFKEVLGFSPLLIAIGMRRAYLEREGQLPEEKK